MTDAPTSFVKLGYKLTFDEWIAMGFDASVHHFYIKHPNGWLRFGLTGDDFTMTSAVISYPHVLIKNCPRPQAEAIMLTLRLSR